MRATVCQINIHQTLEQLIQSSKQGEQRTFFHNIKVRIDKIFNDYEGNLCKIANGKIYYLRDQLEKLILRINLYQSIQNRLIKFIQKLGSFQNKRRRKKNKNVKKL